MCFFVYALPTANIPKKRDSRRRQTIESNANIYIIF